MNFIHRYIPATDPSAPTLLLLHGTGGTEDDLLELGSSFSPGSALLSPRGKNLENGMSRFFRRLAEGVFDEADLVTKTHDLADFVLAASQKYGFDSENVLAAGYSNGANIAASLLLLRPEILRGAILFRAMVPLVPKLLPDLNGVRIFLAAGEYDSMVPMENVEKLAEMLRAASADVTLHWSGGGHALNSGDINAARDWTTRK